MSDSRPARVLDEATRRAIEARLHAIPLARTFGVRLLHLQPGECDLVLDDPFAGDWQVSKRPFERVLAHVGHGVTDK